GEGSNDLDGGVGAWLGLGVEGPGHRGAQVRELGAISGPPGQLVRAQQARPGAPCKGYEVFGVTARDIVGAVVWTAATARVMPEWLEEPVSSAAGRLVLADAPGLRDQTGQDVEHGHTVEAVAAAHGDGGVGVEATDEHARPSEHVSFWPCEQRVGPIDRRTQ